MRRWYLVQSKPFSERIAEENLCRQDYEVYAPRLRRAKRRRGRWYDEIIALFPRYLFLRLSEGNESLAPVRSTVGVANVVRFGANYAIVPDSIVDEIKGRADHETGLHRLSDSASLKVGTNVRVLEGPFSDLSGIFEREDGAERVVVLLKLLGRETRVAISRSLLLPEKATA